MPEVKLDAPFAADEATASEVPARTRPCNTRYPNETMRSEQGLENTATGEEYFFRRTHSLDYAYNAAVQRPHAAACAVALYPSRSAATAC